MVEKSDIKNAICVFGVGIKYYLKYFLTFAKYMAFPVFGQILGIALIAFCASVLLSIIPALVSKYNYFQTFWGIITASIIAVIPGLVIFSRALWGYITAYGAISSMTSNMLKSGNIYDIAAHNELINSRAVQYIFLWLIFGIFSVLAFFPIFWIPALILFVYFILIFQVFTLDETYGGQAVDAFKISFKIIKGHFFATLILLIFAGLISYVVIPEILYRAILYTGVSSKLPALFGIPLDTIVYSPLNLTAATVFDLALKTTISTIVIMFTLPLRSLIWTLWYKKLTPKYNREQKKVKKSVNKKLDKKILDRAMEDYQ